MMNFTLGEVILHGHGETGFRDGERLNGAMGNDLPKQNR